MFSIILSICSWSHQNSVVCLPSESFVHVTFTQPNVKLSIYNGNTRCSFASHSAIKRWAYCVIELGFNIYIWFCVCCCWKCVFQHSEFCLCALPTSSKCVIYFQQTESVLIFTGTHTHTLVPWYSINNLVQIKLHWILIRFWTRA